MWLKEFLATQSTYTIIRRCEQTYKKIPGRPAVVSTQTMIGKVINLFKTQPNISVRAAVQKLKISKSTLSRIKVQALKIKAYTKKAMAKYVKDHASRGRLDYEEFT